MLDFKKSTKSFICRKKAGDRERPKANYIAVRGTGDPNEESLCVQIMHLGAFDDESATVALMDKYLAQNGYVNDFSGGRLHHEIYMSDARKVAHGKWKTVIRHPIRKM